MCTGLCVQRPEEDIMYLFDILPYLAESLTEPKTCHLDQAGMAGQQALACFYPVPGIQVHAAVVGSVGVLGI